jgi:hypothetical protein
MTRPTRSSRHAREAPREELYAVANTPGWQGYLSVPAKATAAYGRDIETWWIDSNRDPGDRVTTGETSD